MIEGQLMSRPGRPRKSAGREPSGRLKHSGPSAREREITAVAASQPHRRAFEKPTDPLTGYALGRLLLVEGQSEGEGITPRQHDAGLKFVSLYTRNARLRGWPNPNLKSPGNLMVAAGLDVAPEPDDDTIASLRREWQEAYRAILDAEKDFGPLFEAVKRVCIEDRDPDVGGMRFTQIGALRIALNALAHLWRG